MRIGSSKGVRDIDRSCVDEYGIPSIVLMETAALKLLNNIDINNNTVFTIVCGNGNNGGDALALARLLLAKNKRVDIFLISTTEMQLSKDCKINFDIINSLGIHIELIHNQDALSKLEESIKRSNIVIDGVLGTGISREVNGIHKRVIEVINNLANYIISIDVPSGLNSDTGEKMGISIKANKTVTFQLYKIGFLNYKCKKYTGDIILEELNIPKIIIEKNHKDIFMTTREFVKNNIITRDKYNHKGDFGRVLIFAGSIGFTGAAYICTQAVVRSGAGLVTLCCDEKIQGILSARLIEAMTINNNSYDGIANKSDVIAIGPGMGDNADTLRILKGILNNFDKPLVIDADGINVLKGNVELLKLSKNKVILTPHPGEMARLTGYSIAYINENRIKVAKEFASENNVIVLLKGLNTVITDGNKVYINPTGNSAMASGGMGDCLTGIIASLIGQRLEPFTATIVAAYIHGYIGDKLSKKMYCVNATHIIENIPHILKELKDI